jgi:hypothetical protein
VDSGAAARAVRSTLRDAVIPVLAKGIPEIRRMPAGNAYEEVMGDIGLLERSFGYFRSNRKEFETIIVDPSRRAVNDDAAALQCGRSLDDVIAMIVRSAASRYFRKQFGDPARALGPRHGMLAMVRRLLRRVGRRRVTRTRADELYKAIRQYLLYEWQIPLFPAYSELTPGEVATLGPRITELKTSNAVMVATGRAVAEPEAPPPPPAATGPVFLPEPRLDALLTEDGQRLKVEALHTALADPEVRSYSQNGEQQSHLRKALRSVAKPLVRLLAMDLNLDDRQIAVILARAQAVMLPSTFERVIQGEANSPHLAKLAGAAIRAKIGPRSSIADCAGFIDTEFRGR